MQALAGISFVLLVVCAGWVGVRLLLIWRRRGGRAEVLLGTMILCLMGIGYPLAVAAQAEAQLGLAVCKTLQVIANGMLDVGFGLAYVFTWRVFRPSARWARWLTFTGVLALAFHWAVVAWMLRDVTAMANAIKATRVVAQIAVAAGCIGYAWSAAEALHYHGLLRRRLSLGLADPVTCNRVLLWAVLGVLTTLGLLANTIFLLTHVEVTSDPVALFVNSSIGIGQAAVLYLAFIPPARYAAWINARATG